MKLLLLGRNGQVGWELQRSLAPLGGLSSLVTLDLAWCDRLQGTLEPLGGLGNLEALCLHFCVGLRGRLEPLAQLLASLLHMM